MIIQRSIRPHSTGVAVAIAVLLSLGCAGPEGRDGPAATVDARDVDCAELAPETLSERLGFASKDEAAELLSRPDDWARQLSAFERSARRGAVEPTSRQELLAYVSSQTLDWTPGEQAYWQGMIDRLSGAAAGLEFHLPQLWLVKSTGLDEFGAAYHRNGAIVLPADRVDISGDDPRSDFFLLAHELWHALSSHDRQLRRDMYELLGFERFRGIEPPVELEDRRLSNPDGQTYEDALTVRTSDGPADVVPFVRSTVSLEEIIALPTEGPPALFGVLDVLLIPVDIGSGEIVRGPGGELVTYAFGDTDWPAQMQRNTSFIIHPEEVTADNFASLMEWRDSGVAPTDNPGGVPTNDLGLLTAIQEVLEHGCGIE